MRIEPERRNGRKRNEREHEGGEMIGRGRREGEKGRRERRRRKRRR